MKVFVTGGTGFVGSHLLPALLEAEHEVQALVRQGSASKLAPAVRDHAAFRAFEGDLLQPATLSGAGEGCEAVIHLVGIIEEDAADGVTYGRCHVQATLAAIEQARRIGAKRFVHMSTLGTRDQAQSEYHRTKYKAEHWVKLNGIPFVIFRPSVIFGRRDGFVTQLASLIHPVFPVVIPGRGENQFQPVAIENVVEGFVKALTSDKAVGKIYEVGGPSRLTFNQVVDLIAEAKGLSPPLKIHPPITLVKIVAGIMHAIWPGFPISRDQVVMLMEDNICETRKFYEDFEIKPKDFDVQALREYI